MRQNGQKYGPPCPFTKDDTTTHSLSLSTLVILARLLVQEKEYKTSPEQMCRSNAIPWCIPCIPKNCCANNVTVYPTVSFGRLLTMKGDTRIGTANTVLRACRSVVTKRELSKAAKLSICKSVFVPILTYGHEPWVKIKSVMSEVQVAKMFFLRRVHCVTLRNRVCSCEICKALNLKPHLLRIEISATLIRPCVLNTSEIIGEASPAGYTQRNAD